MNCSFPEVSAKDIRAACICCLRRIVILVCLSIMTAEAEEYYISRLPARLVPRQVVSLNMPQSGEVEIVRFCERAQKGELMMRLNPRESEWADTELRLELQRDESKLKEELLQLQRQKEELTFVTELSPEQRIFLRDKFRGQADSRVLALLEEKITLLQESAAAQKAKKQALHERKRAESELRMPFDGVLQFHIQPPEGGTGYVAVAGGAALVTVADDSELYLAVTLPNSEWVDLPAERLLLRLEDGGVHPLTARWHHSSVEKTDRMEGRVFYFSVEHAQKERAWKLLGTRPVVKMYYEGAGLLYLRKDEVAKAAAGQVFETWAELVRTVYPGYCILFCGETHLALQRAESI